MNKNKTPLWFWQNNFILCPVCISSPAEFCQPRQSRNVTILYNATRREEEACHSYMPRGPRHQWYDVRAEARQTNTRESPLWSEFKMSRLLSSGCHKSAKGMIYYLRWLSLCHFKGLFLGGCQRGGKSWGPTAVWETWRSVTAGVHSACTRGWRSITYNPN